MAPVALPAFRARYSTYTVGYSTYLRKDAKIQMRSFYTLICTVFEHAAPALHLLLSLS